MLTSDKLTEFCKSSGNDSMNSQKRLFVVKTLERMACSITAEDLWCEIRATGVKIGFPSIYRILNWLIEHGFVKKAGARDGKVLYRVRK